MNETMTTCDACGDKANEHELVRYFGVCSICWGEEIKEKTKAVNLTCVVCKRGCSVEQLDNRGYCSECSNIENQAFESAYLDRFEDNEF